MFTVTETTREEVEKVLTGLGWVIDFWNEKMRLIVMEGKMDRDHFMASRDCGIKFMESFILPTAEVYEGKLLEFPAESAKVEEDVEINPGDSSNPVDDGFLSGVPSGRRGRKLGSKNKPKDGSTPKATVDDRVPVPVSLAPEPTVLGSVPTPTVTVVGTPDGTVTYPYRRPHTKNRKSFKGGELAIEQRDRITDKWVENRGVMTDLKCSDLAKEMGFGGPNQVQGWVSYLTKVCNNNPTYEGRAKGWQYMISNGKISDRPVPAFFVDRVEVAFTTRPKAVV